MRGRGIKTQAWRFSSRRQVRGWMSFVRMLLIAALVVSLLPAGTSTVSANTGVTYLDQNGDLQTNENVAVIHDASDLNNSTLASGWYLFSGAWSLSNRINITGDVHIILEDGSDVEAPQGIDVSNNNLLTIYAQSTGSGTLEPLGMRVAQGSEAANGVLVVRLR
ncbi:hypothetical protein MKX68_04295 [Paenibacillus sp. FSL M8-0212]|uniref:hypothetical protein n=1 Tax=unclassified Paenibacillus TaxID=185978 RepID=UPI00096E9208|nr:hypothetical protein [Paenibacillus sp. FSL R5-0765]OMF66378.1 hypothetical protein BK141_05520 [Paenibacillus sp. FSL R5-0765]